MKTFKEIAVGDNIWFGINPNDKVTVTSIETTPIGGKIFHFEGILFNKNPFKSFEQIGPSYLDKQEAICGLCNQKKAYSTKEAAVEGEIAKYEHVIHCIEGEIELQRQRIERYKQAIQELKKRLQ